MLKKTIFDQIAHEAEGRAIEDGDLQQLRFHAVAVDAVGLVNNGNPIPVDCNGFVLMPSFGLPETGDLVQSSGVARLMVRINREDYPWLPYSLVKDSGDFYQATGTIRKIWIRVITPEVGKKIYLALLKGISFGGAAVSSGSTYASPVAAPAPSGGISGGGTTTTTTTSGGGASYSPRTPRTNAYSNE